MTLTIEQIRQGAARELETVERQNADGRVAYVFYLSEYLKYAGGPEQAGLDETRVRNAFRTNDTLHILQTFEKLKIEIQRVNVLKRENLFRLADCEKIPELLDSIQVVGDKTEGFGLLDETQQEQIYAAFFEGAEMAVQWALESLENAERFYANERTGIVSDIDWCVEEMTEAFWVLGDNIYRRLDEVDDKTYFTDLRIAPERLARFGIRPQPAEATAG